MFRFLVALSGMLFADRLLVHPDHRMVPIPGNGVCNLRYPWSDLVYSIPVIATIGYEYITEQVLVDQPRPPTNLEILAIEIKARNKCDYIRPRLTWGDDVTGELDMYCLYTELQSKRLETLLQPVFSFAQQANYDWVRTVLGEHPTPRYSVYSFLWNGELDKAFGCAIIHASRSSAILPLVAAFLSFSYRPSIFTWLATTCFYFSVGDGATIPRTIMYLTSPWYSFCVESICLAGFPAFMVYSVYFSLLVFLGFGFYISSSYKQTQNLGTILVGSLFWRAFNYTADVLGHDYGSPTRDPRISLLHTALAVCGCIIYSGWRYRLTKKEVTTSNDGTARTSVSSPLPAIIPFFSRDNLFYTLETIIAKSWVVTQKHFNAIAAIKRNGEHIGYCFALEGRLILTAHVLDLNEYSDATENEFTIHYEGKQHELIVLDKVSVKRAQHEGDNEGKHVYICSRPDDFGKNLRRSKSTDARGMCGIITEGMFATGDYDTLGHVFVHTCSTVPGHSGAPLVDALGRVIGIHEGGITNRSIAANYFISLPSSLQISTSDSTKVRKERAFKVLQARVEELEAQRMIPQPDTPERECLLGEQLTQEARRRVGKADRAYLEAVEEQYGVKNKALEFGVGHSHREKKREDQFKRRYVLAFSESEYQDLLDRGLNSDDIKRLVSHRLEWFEDDELADPYKYPENYIKFNREIRPYDASEALARLKSTGVQWDEKQKQTLETSVIEHGSEGCYIMGPQFVILCQTFYFDEEACKNVEMNPRIAEAHFANYSVNAGEGVEVDGFKPETVIRVTPHKKENNGGAPAERMYFNYMQEAIEFEDETVPKNGRRPRRQKYGGRRH